MKSLPLLFAQGYLGEPFTGPTHYGLKYFNYYEATTYLGVPALALAIVALLGARRRPVVIGLGAALVVAFVMSYDPVGLGFFFRVVNHIGGLREIRFERTKAVGGFVVAALGAVGFDECWSAVTDRRVLRRQWVGFGAIARSSSPRSVSAPSAGRDPGTSWCATCRTRRHAVIRAGAPRRACCIVIGALVGRRGRCAAAEPGDRRLRVRQGRDGRAPRRARRVRPVRLRSRGAELQPRSSLSGDTLGRSLRLEAIVGRTRLVGLDGEEHRSRQRPR